MFPLIFALGSSQGLFLAAVLGSRRRNTIPNRLLAAVMLVFSLDLASAAYHGASLEHVFPHLIGLDVGLGLLYGPLFYLYVRTLTHPEHRLSSRDSLHVVPFVLLIAYLIPFFASSGVEKLAFLQNQHGTALGRSLVFITHAKILHAVVYLGLTIGLLTRHRRRVRDHYSFTSRVDLVWLRNVTLGATGLALVSVGLYLFRMQVTDRVVGLDASLIYDNIPLLGVTLFVYSVGYMGLRQREIMTGSEYTRQQFRQNEAGAEEGRPDSVEQRRYIRSGMTEEAARTNRRALLRLMEDECPYRRGDLTLAELAETAGLSPHNLSEVLSTQVGTTFYDFVNGYRVREVQARLADPANDHLSVIGIALDAGFNSKSAFNAAFKKHAGMTPSAFRRSRSERALSERA